MSLAWLPMATERLLESSGSDKVIPDHPLDSLSWAMATLLVGLGGAVEATTSPPTTSFLEGVVATTPKSHATTRDNSYVMSTTTTSCPITGGRPDILLMSDSHKSELDAHLNY